ncbi:MAG: 16S rRNA (adenine(1518)-N(6)/adenine(1519)-N(6))-dimethyltransferase RsmA, partial [Myxococcota bacterium]
MTERPRAKKSLGQHFLIDRNIVGKIAAACALHEGDVVLEIGPGTGALTRALAQTGARVIAVEIDPRLVAILEREKIPRVTIVHGDALELDLARLAQEAGRRLVVAGNLPYNISSPVLFLLLDVCEAWSRAVLMLQREVAVRLGAPPGGKDYGVLAARLGALVAVDALFDVAPGCFRPPPAVRSRVVRVTPLPVPRIRAPADAYARVVRAAFGKRRKTLANALRGL